MVDSMINDLGHTNLLSPFLVKLGFIAACVGCILFLCIALSIAVRIGNFILGF